MANLPTSDAISLLDFGVSGCEINACVQPYLLSNRQRAQDVHPPIEAARQGSEQGFCQLAWRTPDYSFVYLTSGVNLFFLHVGSTAWLGFCLRDAALAEAVTFAKQA